MLQFWKSGQRRLPRSLVDCLVRFFSPGKSKICQYVKFHLFWGCYLINGGYALLLILVFVMAGGAEYLETACNRSTAAVRGNHRAANSNQPNKSIEFKPVRGSQSHEVKLNCRILLIPPVVFKLDFVIPLKSLEA